MRFVSHFLLLCLIHELTFAAEPCEKPLAKLSATTEVGVIWYPKPGGNAWSTHVDISLPKGKNSDDFTIFRVNGAPKKKPSEEVAKIAAESGEGKPYVRFAIKAAPEQVKAMRQVVDELIAARKANKEFRNERTCVGAVCDVLAAGGIEVPFPFNRSPLLLTAYLRFKQSYPGKVEVTSVQYVGGQNLSLATTKAFGEALKVTAAGTGLALAAAAPILAGVLTLRINVADPEDDKKTKVEEVAVPIYEELPAMEH